MAQENYRVLGDMDTELKVGTFQECKTYMVQFTELGDFDGYKGLFLVDGQNDVKFEIIDDYNHQFGVFADFFEAHH
jgi:hypothetical protein